jgi:sugar phosphate isomerase/epimerase
MRDLLLHSVSYAGFWGQASLSVDQFIDKAADLGYNGVMLMAKRPHVSILDYGEKERAALRKRMEARKLATVCIAGYCNLTGDLEHGEVPHREIQVNYILELARLTRDLGARVLRVFTGYENPAASYSPQWRLIVDILRECARRAAEWDVLIGVQNHHDIAVGYESQYDLIQEIAEPNCRALFDAWAPALHGVDIVAAARKLAPLTVHTTVADYQLRPRYKYNAAIVNYEPQPPFVQAVPMGEGFIDYTGFFTALDDAGFEGSVAYEMCSPLLGGGSIENLDRCAARFLDYMSRFTPTTARAADRPPAARTRFAG